MPPPLDGPPSAIMGSTLIVGTSTSGASNWGSSRTGEDMYADGSAGSLVVGLTGAALVPAFPPALPPAQPAAAAAALPEADAGAANFFSAGLLSTGAAD